MKRYCVGSASEGKVTPTKRNETPSLETKILRVGKGKEKAEAPQGRITEARRRKRRLRSSHTLLPYFDTCFLLGQLLHKGRGENREEKKGKGIFVAPGRVKWGNGRKVGARGHDYRVATSAGTGWRAHADSR